MGIAKKYQAPTTCRTCGKTAGEVRFYPSRPNECIDCIVAKRKAKDDQGTKGYRVLTEGTSDPAAGRYECSIHGPHDGTMFGGRTSSNCPECVNIKRKESIKATSTVIAGVREVLVKHPWIEDWMEEEAAKRGIVNRWEVLTDIAKQIPPEWFKAWALRAAK